MYPIVVHADNEYVELEVLEGRVAKLRKRSIFFDKI